MSIQYHSFDWYDIAGIGALMLGFGIFIILMMPALAINYLIEKNINRLFG